jgi:hypothetical protein
MSKNLNILYRKFSSPTVFFISFCVIFVVGIAPFFFNSEFNPDYSGYRYIYNESGAWLEGQKLQSLYLAYNNWHRQEFNTYDGFRLSINFVTLFLYLLICLIIFRITKLPLSWLALIIFCIFFNRNIILLRENLAFFLACIGILLTIYSKPKIISKPIGISFISISPFFHTGGLLIAFMYFFRNFFSIKHYNYFLFLAIIIPAACVFLFKDLILGISGIFDIGAENTGWSLVTAGYFSLNIFLMALLLKLSLHSSPSIKKLNLATILFIVIPSISILFAMRTLEFPASKMLMPPFTRSFDIGIHFLFIFFCLDLQKINNTFKLASLIFLLKTLTAFRYYNW